jgi:hypothetical protein
MDRRETISEKRTLKLKIQFLALTKHLTKQLVLVTKSIFKFSDSQRKTLGRWVITYIGFRVRYVPRWLAHEAKAGEVGHLALGPLILLRVGAVIAGEVEVAKGCTRSGHHLLKLLLLVPEAVLLLIITLVVVVPLDVVVFVGGGVELLSLRAVGDEVGGVVALEAAPRRSPPLLMESVQCAELPRQQDDLVIGMLSYCSSEAAHKEDKTNSKADESVVLVGLATWPPTRVLVTKVLLVREALWFGRPFLDNSWDFNLLNSFSVSMVAKSADTSKAVSFMPQTESSHTTIV